MRTLLVILLTGLCAGLASAGEPPPEPAPYVEVLSFGRSNRYAVWQNYAVDRHGFFRPRVIYTPDGAFYYYDGRPYTHLISHPLNFMPYASN